MAHKQPAKENNVNVEPVERELPTQERHQGNQQGKGTLLNIGF